MQARSKAKLILAHNPTLDKLRMERRLKTLHRNLPRPSDEPQRQADTAYKNLLSARRANRRRARLEQSSKKTLDVTDDDAMPLTPRCQEFLEWYEQRRHQLLSIGVDVVHTVSRQSNRAP